ARAAAPHRRGDVDAQPGADGAWRAGVHGACGALRFVSGARGVRDAGAECEERRRRTGATPALACDDLDGRHFLTKTRGLPSCRKLRVLPETVTATVGPLKVPFPPLRSFGFSVTPVVAVPE